MSGKASIKINEINNGWIIKSENLGEKKGDEEVYCKTPKDILDYLKGAMNSKLNYKSQII